MRQFVLTALLLIPFAAWAVEEPRDYRQEDYDAPVPETLQGAVVVEDDQAHAYWKSGDVVFVDVMPDLPRPKGLPEGMIWRGRARHSVPGAIWLPRIGFGRLDEAGEAQFEQGLRKAVGAKDRPVLFLCRADCWMSWNAARRAVLAGYETVYWYPSGTTGWTFWDWPTERLKPFKFD